MLLKRKDSKNSSQLSVKNNVNFAISQGSQFDTKHLLVDLKSRSVRGGAVTFIGQGTKFFLKLGSTMVLARILTPQDFGLIAMVVAVTGFIMVFKDLGLSMATVQKAEINHGQISTLFWINIAISSALMLITMALAPAVAWFYKEPRLLWVTIALASAFIFGGLTVQHQALLRRQMRFVALATIDISSIAAGVATGIVCVLAGLGYWSLVLMQLVTPIAMAVGVWIASGWLPGPPVRRSGVREMLAFGGYLTGFSIVNYFARNLDKVLLGRFWGSQSTGLYAKAYSLLLLPIGQITAPMTAVAVPALSRLQNEPERFRNYYLKAIKLIAYITMPIVVTMGVLATEVVTLILGEQWTDAGPIFRILAFAAFWQPVCGTVGWIYVSLNQTRRMAIWGAIACPIIMLSFVIGLPWGVKGVATGYATCILLLLYPMMFVALKHAPIRIADVFLTIYRPFVLSIVTGLGIYIGRGFIPGADSISTILGALVAGAISFLITLLIWPTTRKEIQEIISIGALILSQAKAGSKNADSAPEERDSQ